MQYDLYMRTRTGLTKIRAGIVFLSIRDSPKLGSIAPKVKQDLLDALTQPISNVYNNFENFQDINSDMLINHAKSWMKSDIDRVDIQYDLESYVPILQEMDSLRINNPRASLSWRLTSREKYGIITSINSRANQEELKRLGICWNELQQTAFSHSYCSPPFAANNFPKVLNFREVVIVCELLSCKLTADCCKLSA